MGTVDVFNKKEPQIDLRLFKKNQKIYRSKTTLEVSIEIKHSI